MKIKYKFHFISNNLTMKKINLAATFMLLSIFSVNGQEYLKEFKKIPTYFLLYEIILVFPASADPSIKLISSISCILVIKIAV